MDHDAFVRRTRKALTAKSEARPDEAVAELRALLQDLAPAAKLGVNEWHQQQALGVLVDALDAAGRYAECRAAWQELIELTQGAVTYWETALSAAREHFARWNAAHADEIDEP
jgi:hypothetical protein